ncbi:hypothetical protein BDN67DRAFT_914181 [Paxillus ammoniavirescens]|nr:hypothetical protein BDN67DRAFT_914181 [Paxillus ammoniavirescens]
MKDNRHHGSCKDNPYFPFTGVAEWSLAKFLTENLTQAQINCFLKLQWVCYIFKKNSKPHFTTTDELLNWINILPPGPTWHAVQLEVQGYRTISSIHMIWHDGLDTVRTLVGNTIFGQNMMFDPIKIHQNYE